MKTLLDVRKGVVEIVDMPNPICTDDTMLVKNIYSGISNGTERNVLMGGCCGRGEFPDKCNYQPVAKVVEVGKNIKNYKIGDIVVDGTVPGHVQYHLLKEDDLMAKLPPSIDLLSAALLGVTSVAVHDVQRACVTPDDRVLVLGAGVIGQMLAQAATAFGASVTVADLIQSRLDIAKELGADDTYNLSKKEEKEALLGKEENFNVFFETTGSDAVLKEHTGTGFDNRSVFARNCRLVIVAGRDDITYNSNAVQIKECTIVHVHHYDQRALNTALRLMEKGVIRTRPLITRIVPFAEAPELFEIMRDDPHALFGTVIDWQEVTDD